ncbi:MAG TPA: hypothetical protein VM677_14325 [Actinokineospora sp.]|nr:hypothetical protein [Actinokineospora sp.]
MGKTVVTVVVAVLVGLGLATGVTYGVMASSTPDKNVNFKDVAKPNNWGSDSSAVEYGNP